MQRVSFPSLHFFLPIFLLTWPCMSQTNATGMLLVISVDGLMPDYVLQADKYHLKIPQLRRLMAEGSYASGVRGVLPTVTYPTHTTLVTGVYPARHAIIANKPFDPFKKNLDGWCWYSEDIKVPTLWDAATQAGLVTGSVEWPVTVGARITYNIAQYWRAVNAEDVKIIRAVSTPGLVSEAEHLLGPYPNGGDYSPAAERQRAAFNIYILETKKPQLHFCYFSGLDEAQHEHGPFTPEVFETLEGIDAMVGQVRAAADKISGGQTTVCLVSDHGHIRFDRLIHLNAALAEAELLQVDDQGKLKDWRAYAWHAGGCSAVMVQDPNDTHVMLKVGQVLGELARDPANGIDRVLEGPAIRELGGFPKAAYVVGAKPGYAFGPNFKRPLVTPSKPGGTHGYLSTQPEMNAVFFIAGPGIPAGKNLGVVDIRGVAPTLAARLKLRLPAAEGRDLLQ
jgi:predicted AlkP superfamily pyrophosphatase or phosphodiesterase